MSLQHVVWREAGVYGTLGAFEAQQQLGTFTLGVRPEPGVILELRDDEHQVVSVGLGYCHVEPNANPGLVVGVRELGSTASASVGG
jgi:hypothetical protein